MREPTDSRYLLPGTTTMRARSFYDNAGIYTCRGVNISGHYQDVDFELSFRKSGINFDCFHEIWISQNFFWKFFYFTFILINFSFYCQSLTASLLRDKTLYQTFREYWIFPLWSDCFYTNTPWLITRWPCKKHLSIREREARWAKIFGIPSVNLFFLNLYSKKERVLWSKSESFLFFTMKITCSFYPCRYTNTHLTRV